MQTRRAVLHGLTAAAVIPSAHAAGERCLDYGRSFINHEGGQTTDVRFWIESSTAIIEPSGTRHDFYLCGSCKAEELYVAKDLFKPDNYDFTPIFGREMSLFFRRWPDDEQTNRAPRRQISTSVSDWGKRLFDLKQVPATVLNTFDDIAEATKAGRPIVVRTELHNQKSGWRAVIEYPVKTININKGTKRYQTDTGPIAYPDLSALYDPIIGGLELAFIAINAPHFADFVIERRTRVDVTTAVYHYSERVQHKAKNTLLATSST